MKLEPNKFYKEERKQIIYYIYTDNKIVYDVMCIYKETNKVTKHSPTISFAYINEFNGAFCNDYINTDIVELSESDFLLETL